MKSKRDQEGLADK
jgi:farnesyl diphosphate synthase